MAIHISIADRDMKMLMELKQFAQPVGAVVELQSEGHFHIKGALLVNYYPFAAKRTAYVAGTTKSTRNVDPKSAVELSQKLPDLAPFKRKNYRQVKLKMLAKSPFCKWCSTPLDDETATVDHVIPLSRGGLDNDNNRVLACVSCNNKRGNDMPELKAKL